ncbi:hypothetical protein APSETT445_007733 [Aspergillus pseudonomiae]
MTTELVVLLGNGTTGDFIAGEGETEAFEDILAVFDESLEPFPASSGAFRPFRSACVDKDAREPRRPSGRKIDDADGLDVP